MTDQQRQWPIERRTMPGHLAAEAAAHPGGWVYEIDGSMVSNPDGYVPAEAIIGGFAVGKDGRPTGEYARNPGHGRPAMTSAGSRLPITGLAGCRTRLPGRSAASSRRFWRA